MNTFERLVVAGSTVAAVNLAAAPAIGAGLQELASSAVCQEYDSTQTPADPVFHCDESFATRMGNNIKAHEGIIAIAGLIEVGALCYVLTDRGRSRQSSGKWSVESV